MSDYGSIKINFVVKVVAVGVVLLTFFLSWSTINRALGVMVAANATSKEIAEVGTLLAPDSAWAHFALATLLEKTFLPDDLVRSRQEFEKAVELSPSDYRLWMGLGGSLEKSGDGDRAEVAFRNALGLASNYSQVQWTVGNFFLRRDKNDEAFELIRSAASKDPSLAASASSVAWNLYDGDLALIKKYFGDSTNLKGGLAVFLAGQGKLDEAMDVWAGVPQDAMKDKLAPLGESLLAKLKEAKRYLLIVKFLELQGIKTPKDGMVTNGSFEDPIVMTNGGIFDWQFTDAPDIQIGVDPSQMHDGRKETALAMVFKSDGRSFREVSQTVPVEFSNWSAAFSLKYKSDLDYPSTMRWEVVDTRDSKVIASTEPIKGKSDWTTLRTTVFMPDTEGVVIRLVRVPCGSPICPISGRVWFDDVSLVPFPK